jgi:hypothetical protein
MTLKTIIDTLEAARQATADLSLADDLRIAQDELYLVDDGRSLAEISCGADAFEAIQNHLKVNPLARTDEDDDLSGTLSRLAHWLGELERLAQ